MSRFNIDQMKIATPCTADWNTMRGDNRSRFCGECKLNVFNIEGLTRKETETLLGKAAQGERVCMRFFRRPDGTVITKDCPVGVRLARRVKLKLAALRLGLSALIFGGGTTACAEGKQREVLGRLNPVKVRPESLTGKVVPQETGYLGGVHPPHSKGPKPKKPKTLKEYEAEPLVGELQAPAEPKDPGTKHGKPEGSP